MRSVTSSPTGQAGVGARAEGWRLACSWVGLRVGLFSAVLAGCATGPVISPFPGNPDVWVLRREAPARYPTASELQASAFKEAGEHCAARQGEPEVIDVQESQGWGVTGNYPTLLVRFRCVPAAPKPQVSLPARPASATSR